MVSRRTLKRRTVLEKILQSADNAILEKELCLSETQNFDSNSRTTKLIELLHM